LILASVESDSPLLSTQESLTASPALAPLSVLAGHLGDVVRRDLVAVLALAQTRLHGVRDQRLDRGLVAAQ
jgi:hypothetical protein